MGVHFGKFVHTKTGKTLMSLILGFGLASLFRKICKEKNCLLFYAPPMEELDDKIYKSDGRCVKYKPVATKCSMNAKTLTFE
jgi:CRISPR/Cas system-associated endonuclease/helicase Cas3